MENACIELHDSTVQQVSVSGSTVPVFFSRAYLHKSAGLPGVDPGTVWSQPAELAFLGASLRGPIPRESVTISDGSLELGSSIFPNTIPIPLEHTGNVRLTLVLPGASPLVVTASAVVLRLFGEPRLVESFPGSSGVGP